MNDNIRPKHYQNGMETIEVLKNTLTAEQFEGFLIGNVIKYISRYKNKNGVEDLKKAGVYLQWLVDMYVGK